MLLCQRSSQKTMITKQLIKQDIDEFNNLENLMGVYEEIAAIRMKRVRGMVLKNRDFLEGITKIFQEVQISYKKQLGKLMKQKKITDPAKISVIPRNGKTAYLYISVNQGLYGSIVADTFGIVADAFEKQKADVFIIGSIGKALFENRFPTLPYTYFPMADDRIDHNQLKMLIQQLIPYDTVIGFYGVFQSVVSQKPTARAVSGMVSASETEQKVPFFFEPDLEQVAIFFETEIFASLFEQILHESFLARYASRMISLTIATDTIEKKRKAADILYRNADHILINQKQLNLLSGLLRWRK